jgi:hypothetical protein
MRVDVPDVPSERLVNVLVSMVVWVHVADAAA